MVPEGKLIGTKIKLRKWQRDFIKQIYDNPHGTRTAILSIPRKNGKTALIACLVLLHLAGPESEPNSQLYSSAMSRDQAGVIFELAAKMVRMNPDLDINQNGDIGIRESNKGLYVNEIGTAYAALSADATTAHGRSPIFVVHDELGQVKGPKSDLFNVLETAGGAHEAPMSIIISTQATSDGDLLSILIDDAKSGREPEVVCTVYGADKDADPFDKSTIKEANPAYNDFLNAKVVLKAARDAQAMPSQEAAFRNLHLNQRVESHSPFISKSVWEACGSEVLDDWADLPVYGGLDLSSTTDLTALTLIACHEGVWQVRPTFWLPEDGLVQRGRKDRVPYDVWHDQGFLNTSPGPTVEYEWVAHELRRVFDDYMIEGIAFDRWGWKYLLPWLKKVGFKEEELSRFIEFGQGFASMTPALRALETLVLQRKLAHGKHPVLTMCMANSVVQTDTAGNRKLDKSRSTGRIDGAVALTMAAAATSLYEQNVQSDWSGELFFV